MSSRDAHVFPAASAAQRGLPPVELRFDVPPGLALTELAPEAERTGEVVPIFSGEERDDAGRRIGWLELGLFGAALIIDRAGALREVATAAAGAALAGPGRGRLIGQGNIELAGGATGYRVEALLHLGEDGRFRPACPYVSWLAVASPDPVVNAGLFALLRSAGPDWRAGAELLDSLAIGGAGSSRTTPGGVSPGLERFLHLPLVRRR